MCFHHYAIPIKYSDLTFICPNTEIEMVKPKKKKNGHFENGHFVSKLLSNDCGKSGFSHTTITRLNRDHMSPITR